ncbi:hypothetical protein GN244_ATG00709 [Phytophthora infestans]|uniref:Uncharacterized protein n=1 Tax=Phytophthora infestans TaxID=4787 RepID=A0A833WQH3_PHYIN|nr:hypothetical protein GN244_ATG00709 [Phytophthora infestans]
MTQANKKRRIGLEAPKKQARTRRTGNKGERGVEVTQVSVDEPKTFGTWQNISVQDRGLR